VRGNNAEKRGIISEIDGIILKIDGNIVQVSGINRIPDQAKVGLRELVLKYTESNYYQIW
jgi:hypothetical protein